MVTFHLRTPGDVRLHTTQHDNHNNTPQQQNKTQQHNNRTEQHNRTTTDRTQVVWEKTTDLKEGWFEVSAPSRPLLPGLTKRRTWFPVSTERPNSPR